MKTWQVGNSIYQFTFGGFVNCQGKYLTFQVVNFPVLFPYIGKRVKRRVQIVWNINRDMLRGTCTGRGLLGAAEHPENKFISILDTNSSAHHTNGECLGHLVPSVFRAVLYACWFAFLA